MSELIPEQRMNVHGHLVTKHVRPPAAPAMSRAALPPVNLSMAPQHLQRSYEVALTNPESIKWDKLSKEDIEKIAEFSSNEMEFTANAEGMFDLYAEMFKSEHLDPQHVRETLEKNNVLKRAKSVFVEVNGLDTEDEWTPEQYAARDEYIRRFALFNEAALNSGAIKESLI